ncbi:endothelial cell-specific chemotaxis regulator-like isoform X4 [Lepus europaeus]|uniref:endothelial cell-specific chemotaxis regulator-like isoform X4 n=1 Tax=Lepus europaeus TaxID=9983 RepID=UPI002B4813C7|nr:endothelial cell-specific chemotaxis regulator-like isoform X4 [Lepus europaeus]
MDFAVSFSGYTQRSCPGRWPEPPLSSFRSHLCPEIRRKLQESWPHPHPAPALPLSSPLWTEPPLSGCLPATSPADMGNARAAQLCWAILGFLLLQGHSSQPTRQTSRPQGAFSSPSLTTEPISATIGDVASSQPNSPSPLSTTATTVASRNISLAPLVVNEAITPRSSLVDSHSASVLGLTQSQPQKHTSGLDTAQEATPNSTTMTLRTRDELSILPSPTSETVLTVAAFGVISFIVILVVVVIVLVSVVSLRFKCRKNKESEDPQKPGSSGLSESCSTANGEKDSITLISMKNINTNNSKGCPSAEKVL